MTNELSGAESKATIDFMLEKILINKDKASHDKIRESQENLPTIAVDIFALCKDITGSEVRMEGLQKETSGYIQKKGNEYSIYCNSGEPKPRQRFTAAHELSHYLLHRNYLKGNYPENTMLRGGLTNAQEIEANKLAADILMPYVAIEKYIKSVDNFTMNEIAKVFNVSYSAIAIRLGIPMDFYSR